MGYDACYTQRIVADDVGYYSYERTINLKKSSGIFQFYFDTRGDGDDQITVRYEGEPIFESGCIETWRSEFLEFSGTSTEIEVTVENCNSYAKSTSWEYTVYCPSE